jgi:release factor glutamine methyltransferase
MQLIGIKQFFFDSLAQLYPEQEIYSLFEQTIEFYLKYNKIQIHQNLHKNIEGDTEKKILAALQRLKRAEPLQYVLGRAYFCDHILTVDRRVLIPRPETEELTDIIIKDTTSDTLHYAIDLCTGSGCIAIALAAKFPHAQLYATDVSENILALTRKNVIDNHVQVTCLQDDLLNPAANYPMFDLIASNPPYVRNTERKFMHRNVLDFEPASALFVEDENPLIFYKAIKRFALKYLAKKGWIYLEINESLERETAALFDSTDFQHVEILKDLNNKSRFIKVCR